MATSQENLDDQLASIQADLEDLCERIKRIRTGMQQMMVAGERDRALMADQARQIKELANPAAVAAHTEATEPLEPMSREELARHIKDSGIEAKSLSGLLGVYKAKNLSALEPSRYREFAARVDALMEKKTRQAFKAVRQSGANQKAGAQAASAAKQQPRTHRDARTIAGDGGAAGSAQLSAVYNRLCENGQGAYANQVIAEVTGGSTDLGDVRPEDRATVCKRLSDMVIEF